MIQGKEKFSVLLIEDDDLDREKMQRAVNRLSIDSPMLHAIDGLEALKMLHDSNLRPRRLVILLDLNMPRMNGHEFLAEIRGDDALRRIPVFVMSTSDRAHDVDLAYEKGVTGYIIKPYSMQETYETVEALYRFWCCLRIPALGDYR